MNRMKIEMSERERADERASEKSKREAKLPLDGKSQAQEFISKNGALSSR
jgi:hypothetical protein